MKPQILLSACLLFLSALPAVAAPYPRYIQRQVANGTMSIEEADMLVENGLGTHPPAPASRILYPSGPTYDSLAAAQAESAYNERVNEARYFGDIQQRDERYYGRNYPGYGIYRGACYYGGCRRTPIYRLPTTNVPVTGNAFRLPPVRTFAPLAPR